jgi:hypothetical protein
MDKIIYMTYKKNVPDIVFKRWLEYNKDYSIDFSLDENCKNFLELNFNNKVSNAFSIIERGMYKADLWRICKLYKNTGVYADIDLVPYINLDHLNINTNFYSVISADNTHIFQAFIVNNCKPMHSLFLVFIISFFINRAWTYQNGPCHDMYKCLKYILGVNKIIAGHRYYSSNVKIKINIGSSNKNIKKIDLTYFPEDIQYNIVFHKTKYDDTFSFEIKDNILIITRTDANSGWNCNHYISICFPEEISFYFFNERWGKRGLLNAYVEDNGKKILDSRDPLYSRDTGWNKVAYI